MESGCDGIHQDPVGGCKWCPSLCRCSLCCVLFWSWGLTSKIRSFFQLRPEIVLREVLDSDLQSAAVCRDDGGEETLIPRPSFRQINEIINEFETFSVCSLRLTQVHINCSVTFILKITASDLEGTSTIFCVTIRNENWNISWCLVSTERFGTQVFLLSHPTAKWYCWRRPLFSNGGQPDVWR